MIPHTTPQHTSHKSRPFTRTAACLAAAILLLQGASAAPIMSPPQSLDAKGRASVLGQLTTSRAAQGLDQDHSYRVLGQHPGARGTQVVRAAHTYKGLRIFGSDSVVVLDDRLKVVSESASPRRLHLGRGAANRLGAKTVSFNVRPQLGAKAAIAAAMAHLVPGAAHIVAPRAELLIYPVMRDERAPGAENKAEEELNAVDLQETVDHYELAWLVRTRMRLGEQPLYHDTVVSARDGQLIDQWSMLQTATGVGKSQYNGEVPLSTTLSDGLYRMLDPERGKGGTFGAMAITNANNGGSAGKVYTNATNTWGDGKQFVEGSSTTAPNGQTAAVNAMWGLMNTYDTMKNVLGWRSLDGHDTATYIAAHVNRGYDNAYYSDTCRCMFIGDGTYFTSLGSIDVIGHEMGHGVTAATSNLVYAGESGGLNESSSDISGEVVEAYARAGGKGEVIPDEGNDWMLGTEISRNGTPLRYMVKPSKDGISHDAWSTRLRRLDVHYSSGPNNRMFYFLARGSDADKDSDAYSKYLVKEPAAMSGIGTDKAFRIWFHANTTKFTSSTNYADARAKMILSAEELYGKDSAEAVAVQRAYAAINVGTDIDEPAGGAELTP
ncbi:MULTISPECIES: M4 family metallopeptidase [unclassified Massilia]|uniref:M4 family metallopeptidase n=1 Tax=unclassified Massilia TaxID=2609279 RepID=UPI001E319FCD|nr:MULTISPECIES: M4 family metallopeptidase [unclassified Massilia]